MSCIFCKIRDGEIAKEFIYQDKDVMVFPDINPIRPVHLLIVPKKHIEDFLDLRDVTLVKKINIIIQKMIKQSKLEDKGYRVGLNGGGAQDINHIHIHLVGPIKKKVVF
jgi:histidine triad (HIT) family protein